MIMPPQLRLIAPSPQLGLAVIKTQLSQSSHPSVTLSSTNLTYSALGLKVGLCSERTMTKARTTAHPVRILRIVQRKKEVVKIQAYRKKWVCFRDVVTFMKIELGMRLAVICSPPHEVFINTQAHILLRILHAHARYTFSCS